MTFDFPGNGNPDISPARAGPRSRKSIRVLLVENDRDVAAVIEREFERDGVSVAIAYTLADARALLQKSSVDVVIVETFLPDGRGESLLPDIEDCPRQPAVIVIGVGMSELQASALEYRPITISKPVDPRALLRIARIVARGFAQPVIGRFVRRFNLTKREAEATTLVSRGLKAKEIADRMSCSEKVVYAHLARACKKIGCHDYHELVALILAFTCQILGHTPPEHAAFVDFIGES
jgi:DNA-binding NarL/FixJ family response regulator